MYALFVITRGSCTRAHVSGCGTLCYSPQSALMVSCKRGSTTRDYGTPEWKNLLVDSENNQCCPCITTSHIISRAFRRRDQLTVPGECGKHTPDIQGDSLRISSDRVIANTLL